MKHPKFEVYKDKKGEFRFRLTAKNGEIILSSEGYRSKQGCKNGIESVKKNSQDDNRFKKLEASNGKTYFSLTARNGEVIGQSQMYKTVSGRDNGISSVGNNAEAAEIDDLS